VPFNFQSYFFGATDIGLVPYTIIAGVASFLEHSRIICARHVKSQFNQRWADPGHDRAGEDRTKRPP
jgi:hypothetical protein